MTLQEKRKFLQELAIKIIKKYQNKSLDKIFEYIINKNNIKLIYTNFNDGSIGEFDYTNNIIYIQEGMTLKEQIEVKYHELSHFFLRYFQINDKSYINADNANNFDEYYNQDEEKLCRDFYLQMQVAETFYK